MELSVVLNKTPVALRRPPCQHFPLEGVTVTDSDPHFELSGVGVLILLSEGAKNYSLMSLTLCLAHIKHTHSVRSPVD